MANIELAAILLVALCVLLAGGLWIGLSLMITGYLAMMAVADVPIGKVLATKAWDSGASWTPWCGPTARSTG